jgi:SAM-dependent methyltransferase/UDP-N-acetylglucosamine transferase subunit ALG13
LTTKLRRLSVFVTVGMGPWPFDRLISALRQLCESHDVFAQTGTSTVVPPCPHQAFVGYDETRRRISTADVVITHGGNTVRLVQRAGKVPIAIAREASRGEMRNDHQVLYLRDEAARGRAVVLDGELDSLAPAVDEHLFRQREMRESALPLRQVDVAAMRELMDTVSARAADNPFRDNPIARYGWAFDQLQGRVGRHLDVGIGDAAFLQVLHGQTSLRVVGADPHAGYLAAARRRLPDAMLVHVRDELPFGAAAFDSVSMLDVLEHTADERVTLAEVHRVLRPGGLLVLTVPARHAFSILDPDNVKFRMPRLHQTIYTARFGSARFHERFVDASDGLRGDMAWSRREHTNYRAADLLGMLEMAGFVPQRRDGANLFWRFLDVPALLAPGRTQRLFDAPLRADSRLFHSANLFLTAVRGDG